MSEIRGPLGLWTFPLLNLLRQVFMGSRMRYQQAASPVMRNIETIRWDDWKGRPRTIEIHREVESAV